MTDGVLAPGVLAPCARYRHYVGGSLGYYTWAGVCVRCADCGGVIASGLPIIEARTNRGRDNWQTFHHDCYFHGAPWRRAAAERAKAGGAS
jgi:hypothetical protein